MRYRRAKTRRVAQVCGTSGQMIFRHYRKWIPGLQNGAGDKIGSLLRTSFKDPSRSRDLSPELATDPKLVTNRGLNVADEAVCCALLSTHQFPDKQGKSREFFRF